MTLVGDAAEKEVASVLSRAGFDLVYQWRASRRLWRRWQRRCRSRGRWAHKHRL